jgi:hypothetical protein
MGAKQEDESMRSKTEVTVRTREATATSQAASRREQIRVDLEARGIDPELCERFSASLERKSSECSPDAYQALLDGVALVCGMQEGVDSGLSRNLHDLQETERLMGAFATELEKLDEVLEVLSAYLRRMRSLPGNFARFVQ